MFLLLPGGRLAAGGRLIRFALRPPQASSPREASASQAPSLLEVPEAPDRQRREPDVEEPGDHEPGSIEVEPSGGARKFAEAEFVRNKAEDLDRAQHEGDRDRQPREREVVSDLADRLGEGPAVGEVDERAVDPVEKRHPGGNEDQSHDRVRKQRQLGGACRRGEDRPVARRQLAGTHSEGVARLIEVVEQLLFVQKTSL